ncbi:hypothetical protein EAS62_31690 [Bradyrhizobium zhanjiangense]|uniref:Uncharacterized protein n=1 Tax=Bradyrhizobium zhanjiangense TaxID=1325107 RepID=A0ABY0DE91_9BRAD|nr:hypothetical protein EAS62_31690 [Bradyrhizobium zhanjiangense]
MQAQYKHVVGGEVYCGHLCFRADLRTDQFLSLADLCADTTTKNGPMAPFGNRPTILLQNHVGASSPP